MEERNLYRHKPSVSREERNVQNGHRSCVLWLTGLSGAGKSTLAYEVERRLYECGIRSYVLDGDDLRSGLNRDVDFTPAGRRENIRRSAEVGKLLAHAGHIVIVALISPYREDRLLARTLIGEDDFVEVFLDCPLEVCEQRDPKGLYKKARSGQIPSFTGVSAPYEPPERPEIRIPSHRQSLEESVMQILKYLEDRKVLEIGKVPQTDDECLRDT